MTDNLTKQLETYFYNKGYGRESKKEAEDMTAFFKTTTCDRGMSDGNDTQKKIAEITEAIRDLLLYKNRQYGNSVLQPNHIFYKGDAVNSILIRLDDKLGRIKANTEDSPRINDIADIIGYCTLLLISIGADKADIENLKD